MTKPINIVHWNKEVPIGVSYMEHRQSFVDAIVAACHLFQRNNPKGPGEEGDIPSRVRVGKQARDIIECLPGYFPMDSNPKVPLGFMPDPSFIGVSGTLNGRWKIIPDLLLPETYAVVEEPGKSYVIVEVV